MDRSDNLGLNKVEGSWKIDKEIKPGERYHLQFVMATEGPHTGSIAVFQVSQ